MRDLVLAVMLSALFGCSNNEIAVYSLRCDKPLVSGVCRSTVFVLSPRHYRVYPDQQRATTWVEGFDQRSLTQCVITDVRNWSCRFPDDSARFVMKNGRMTEWINPDPKITSPMGAEWASREFQTSWIVWQALSFGASYQSGIVQRLEAVTF